MAEGLKSRALSVITRSSKRDHSDVESSPSKSISNSERSNDHGRVAEKNEPSDKRRRSLALELDGMTPLSSTSSIQKDLQDHRNEMRALLDRYMSSLTAQFRDITKEQEEHRRRIDNLEERVSRLETSPPSRHTTSTGSTIVMEDVQKKLEELRDEMEDKSKRLTNIIVTGLAEEDPSPSPENNIAEEPSSPRPPGSKSDPPTSSKVILPPDLVKALEINLEDLLECRRLGKRPQPENGTPSNASRRPRPLLLRFRTEQAKTNVMRRRQALVKSVNFTRVYLNDDLTQLEQSRRRTLVPVFRQLRKARVKCEIRRDKLLYEGKPISITEAEALLKRISASHAQ